MHIPEKLLSDIASRSDRIDDPRAVRSGSAYSNVVRRDVVRYYNLLRGELMTLRLTQAEPTAPPYFREGPSSFAVVPNYRYYRQVRCHSPI